MTLSTVAGEQLTVDKIVERFSRSSTHVEWVRLPFAVRAIVVVAVGDDWSHIRRVAVEASRDVCCRGDRGLRKECFVELFSRIGDSFFATMDKFADEAWLGEIDIEEAM